MKLGDLGEKNFIKRILNIIDEPRNLMKGDDAVDFKVKEVSFIIKADGFSFVSSKTPWNDYYDLGWKAVTSCISDLAVKGGRPIAVLASIGVLPSYEVEDGIKLIRAIRDASHFYSSMFLGGDTNNGEWVDVFCIGEEAKPISRKGANEGDPIFYIGELGLTGIAFQMMKRGKDLSSLFNKEKVLEAIRRPKAFRLWEVNLDCIKASTDVSDGLAESLYNLAEANSLGIHLDFELEGQTAMEAIEKGLDIKEMLFYAGEEFGYLLAVNEECSKSFKDEVELRGGKITRIGVFKGNRVEVKWKGELLERRGWDNLISF
jgi:thiamine-monophosphate kinase